MTSQDHRSEHDTPESDAARALRQQAEARIGNDATRSSSDLAALTPDEIQRTLHELRVHQLELTMQNEELRRAQAAIDAARARYFDLYELAPVGYCTLSETGLILEANLTVASLLATPRSALIKEPLSRFIVKGDQDLYYLRRQRLFETGEPQECELRLVKPDGALFWGHLTATAARAEDGARVCRLVISNITERKRKEEELKAIEWMLTGKPRGSPSIPPENDIDNQGYGDLTALNRGGLISRSIDKSTLRDISSEYLNLLESSSAIYEKNGDYAFGIFCSGWCRLMDSASRKLCNTESNEAALASGQWLCHESCWTDCSKRAIESQSPVDIRCSGGIHLYAVPIFAAGEVIGAINFGYGAPPKDAAELKSLADSYGLDTETLANEADAFAFRPHFFIELAKQRLLSSAGLIGIMVERKEHERQLERLAHYDALTALPNRGLLADRLHQAMAHTQRRGQRLAVGYLDLDGFKTINDQHGHEVGDQVLVAVAKRMLSVLREGDTLARLGGDEFAVVLIDLTDDEVSVPLLNRLLAATAEPVRVGDLLVQVSASLGVTFYPQAGGVDGDLLLRQADQAMYQAKQSGKNRYYLFDTELDQRIRGHHEDLEQIRHALAAHEFVLYYQPKVNLRTGRVIGAEALIRWRHPQRGLLAPALFLPTTENHPLAVELGEWVIKTALAQIDAWQALGLALPVSVNVGAYQLQQVDFVARLRALLGEHPEVAPSCLCLEILETSAIDDLVGTAGMIGACRELGVSVALDDFGTGYSSLTYLKRLAVTQLKIDRSFVSGMLNDPEDLAIVESVLSLAGTFNLQVIAEGVETLEHGEMLLSLGCDLAQGFGIARPMPAHEMPGWLAAWQTPAGWAELPAARREHLPLLYAGVEHRAWVAAIEAHLKHEQGAPPLPPLDARQCRFAAWLRAAAVSGDGAASDFQRIDAVHRQVHGVVDELLELRARGRNPEALARLGELHDLRDTLLDGLKAWMRERGRSTAMIGEARLSDLYGHLGQAR